MDVFELIRSEADPAILLNSTIEGSFEVSFEKVHVCEKIKYSCLCG